MSAILQDLRYALRALARNRGLTAAVVLTLSIGIGANTAVFSFVHALFIKPLPFPDPHQLVQLWGIHRESSVDGGVSVPNFLDWKQQTRAFSGMAAYRFDSLSFGGPVDPVCVPAIRASQEFLPLLGAHPQTGRLFLAEECRPGGNKVAILSWEAWQRRCSGQTALEDTRILLDGQSYTVVGVLPPEFRVKFPFCGQGHAALPEPEIWLPLALDPAGSARNVRSLLTLARLNRGVAMQQAQEEMTTVAKRLETEYPDANKGWNILVLPLHELQQSAGVAAPILLAPVVLVLLIACVNVAHMLLARAAGRRREVAIRLALGASRRRLVRHLLLEGLVLSVTAGVLGILLAQWGCGLIRALGKDSLIALSDVGVNGAVLGYTLTVSLLVGIGIGLVPALQGWRLRLNDLLQEGTTGLSGGLGRRRFSRLLVVAEVALALVLLTATGLLVRSLAWTWNIDLGFRPDRVLCMGISLPAVSYAEPSRQLAFFDQLHQRVRGRPGVESAALVSSLPTENRNVASFRIPGRASSIGQSAAHAALSCVSPEYFEVVRIPLLRGRDFAVNDSEGGPGVAIVNAAMTGKYWPDTSPIGATIEVSGRRVEIVGVVGNLRRPLVAGISEAQPEIYVPYAQWPGPQMTLVARSIHTDPMSIVSQARSEVAGLDRFLAATRTQTLAEAVSQPMALANLILMLMGLFSLSAVVLAAVGVHGLIAYSVSMRTHEIGIRMALGALPADILRMVIGEGSRLLFWGIGLGLPLSLAVGKVLANRIHRVGWFDPVLLVAMGALLAITSLLACYVPARKAARACPLATLRHE